VSADRYAWMDAALCAQADPDTWADTPRGSGSRLPKRICGRRPVRAECAAHADAIHAFDGLAPTGVWGGRSHRQRERDHQQAA
jgi:WhiB family redox-sensing transcriptional regulator